MATTALLAQRLMPTLPGNLHAGSTLEHSGCAWPPQRCCAKQSSCIYLRPCKGIENEDFRLSASGTSKLQGTWVLGAYGRCVRASRHSSSRRHSLRGFPFPILDIRSMHVETS
eukprot:363452-Chlamydomonas_euryale.AAC.8